jgi:antitoxin component YwqK of YwqJK toxin-antitoxin module
MRKILWIIVCIIFFEGCSNVEVVENKDESGRMIERYTVDKKTKLKEGLHEAFHTGGSKSEESNYKNGVLRGEQIFYYENGQIQETRNFDESGSFSGAYKSYHENGNLKSEGQYENGAMNGKWKFFFKTGSIKEIVFFRNNVENGPFVEYHENGKLRYEGTYLNEKEEGLLKVYNDKGELEKHMQCEGGVCRTVWRSDLAKDSIKKM